MCRAQDSIKEPDDISNLNGSFETSMARLQQIHKFMIKMESSSQDILPEIKLNAEETIFESLRRMINYLTDCQLVFFRKLSAKKCSEKRFTMKVCEESFEKFCGLFERTLTLVDSPVFSQEKSEQLIEYYSRALIQILKWLPKLGEIYFTYLFEKDNDNCKNTVDIREKLSEAIIYLCRSGHSTISNAISLAAIVECKRLITAKSTPDQRSSIQCSAPVASNDVVGSGLQSAMKYDNAYYLMWIFDETTIPLVSLGDNISQHRKSTQDRFFRDESSNLFVDILNETMTTAADDFYGEGFCIYTWEISLRLMNSDTWLHNRESKIANMNQKPNDNSPSFF
ncbi:hypothetical protein K7432_007074 [Basidiobolus ranarum]|uniref:Uncharacterized protein n=1 Tax=Basidiobolus ranarum TaxID=34480 RepID=A0ABR2W0P6_9FUNG